MILMHSVQTFLHIEMKIYFHRLSAASSAKLLSSPPQTLHHEQNPNSLPVTLEHLLSLFSSQTNDEGLRWRTKEKETCFDVEEVYSGKRKSWGRGWFG